MPDYSIFTSANCIQETQLDEFWLCDDSDSQAYIIENIDEENSKAISKVTNSQSRKLVFAAIDNCIFPRGIQKMCDCALYSEDKEVVAFIELTTSKEGRGKFSKAVEQLKNAFEVFQVDISVFQNKRAIIGLQNRLNRRSIRQLEDNFKKATGLNLEITSAIEI